MLNGIRQRVRPAPPPVRGAGAKYARPKRVSRREREERQRRLLYTVTALAAVMVVIVLAFGAFWQYYHVPRQVLASVNGSDIQRRDYWKVRGLQLRQQQIQLQRQLSSATDPSKTQQLRQQLTQAGSELADLHGAPVASDTLKNMVDDKVVLQSIDALGISVTDQDISDFINDQFAPSALIPPTETPTVEPTAAAWATSTTEARFALATQTAVSVATSAAQTATANPASPAASPNGDITPTVVPAGSPTVADASPTAPSGSPTAAGSPNAGSPTPNGSPTIEPTATIGTADAIATSASTFKSYKTNLLNPSDMSRGDYERLIIRPAIARQRVQRQLQAAVPARADQVHAEHILVATKDAADAVEARLRNGENFEAVAKDVSTDTSSAGNGGDLGWFPKGVMVSAFEDAAFQLEVGQVSDPVQSSFGWHVIKVLEKEQNRPLTLSTLQSLKNTTFTKWLDVERGAANIHAKISLTSPTAPTNTTFQAPPGAPAPPVPTAVPTLVVPPQAPQSTVTGSPAP